MADQLETLNNVNAASKTLALRVIYTYEKKPKDTMTIFGCYAASKTGAYCMGEATVFGDTNKRRTIVEALSKKWKSGQAWNLSKLQAFRKNDQYHSAPHPFVVNLNSKNLQSKQIAEGQAEAVPEQLRCAEAGQGPAGGRLCAA